MATTPDNRYLTHYFWAYALPLKYNSNATLYISMDLSRSILIKVKDVQTSKRMFFTDLLSYALKQNRYFVMTKTILEQYLNDSDSDIGYQIYGKDGCGYKVPIIKSVRSKSTTGGGTLV